MSDEHYPADLVVTIQDFRDCGLREALGDATREGYSYMWRALSKAAQRAMDEGRISHGKVLWLLGDACSMMLSPRNANEPYKPIMVIEGKRTVIPDDLSESDFAFFAQIVDDISDLRLRARIADLVWLCGKPRDVKFALVAIDAYRCVPLDGETWVRDGRECWGRALGLARMLGKTAVDRLHEMETTILAAFDAATSEDGFLVLWAAELLESHGLGRDRRSGIAQKLASAAREFDDKGDFHRAGEYWQVSSRWFKAAEDHANATEATVELAESWAKQAAVRMDSDAPGYMAASSFYENAIQIYRTIPRAQRAAWRVDERIIELQSLLTAASEKSLAEMGVVRSPEIDITKLVKTARETVRGKDAVDALKALVNLHPGANAKQSREEAIATLGKHPLRAFFPATTMSRDGRVIAKRPGLSLSDPPTEDDEIVIRTQMIQDFEILIGLAVQGEIMPALEVVAMEHRLQERDFVALARQSPIVPPSREGLFGKPLFAGYDRDLVAMLHLLVPQVEHMVRFHLKQAGVRTTTLDGNGIETENGLSKLMAAPESAKVFGEDLTFEFSALLCDPHGPNIRNELAHGLLAEDSCRSVYAVYLWWLVLKLVFNAGWLASRRKASSNGEQNGK